jgi:cardiolipin synthase
MEEWLREFWPYLVGTAAAVLWAFSVAHAVLYRREVHAAIGWAGLVTLTPILGSILYFLLGINRVERKAIRLRRGLTRLNERALATAVGPDHIAIGFGEESPGLPEIALAVGQVTTRPLLAGNAVTPLENGEQAYPEMLAAIEGAERSVHLLTYIFDNDPLGRRFVDALAAARARGVEVRVLIDAAGVRYTRPHVHRLLRRRGVRTALFLPFRLLGLRYANLRTHRKVMVVDGALGFTGGMNVREHHLVSAGTREPTQDIHFRVEGPVVRHLQEVFAEDWEFTTGEALRGPGYFPPLDARGTAFARGIAAGPDQDLNKLPWTMLTALTAARESIRLLTPYFLPDPALIAALNAAALRGISVDIVLPERGNLAVVQWAMWAQLWQVLGRGCRIWLTPPPFDHGKLLVVDRAWSLFGSTNWDARSLRLHFEFNVETYDLTLGKRLAALVDARIAQGRQLSREELDARTYPRRLRDGLARLLTPYL